MAVVEVEKRDRVGIATLNRPEARNAVNGDLANAMEAILDDFEADDAITVVDHHRHRIDVLRRRRPQEGGEGPGRRARDEAGWLRRHRDPQVPKATHRRGATARRSPVASRSS